MIRFTPSSDHEYQKAHPGPVPDSVWSGTAVEQQCMQYQTAVMQRIGASEWELDHVRHRQTTFFPKRGTGRTTGNSTVKT